MMFIGKFDLDLFSDDINETKTKALVRAPPRDILIKYFWKSCV